MMEEIVCLVTGDATDWGENEGLIPGCKDHA